MVNKKRMTFTEFLDNSPMTPFLWMLVLGVAMAQVLDGMDFQITSFNLPLIIKEFKIDSAHAGMISSFGNVGLGIGSLLFALLSDRFGRKPIFQVVLFCFAFGSFLSAVAPTYETLLAARFIAGLGLGAELPVAFTLLAEFSPKGKRHIFVPIASLCFAIGYIVAGLFALWLLPTAGWRALYFIGIAPAFVILYIRSFMPESVRFLLMKGKTDEAGKVAKEIAARSGMADLELVPPDMKEQLKLSYGQQLAMLKVIWVPLVALSVYYFCFFIQTWGIDAWLPTVFTRQGFTLTTSIQYVLIIYCVTPLAHFFAMWIQNRIPRKWALVLVSVVGAFFAIMFGLSFQLKWPIEATIAMQVLQVITLRGGVSILSTITTEICPTPARSTGTGIVNAAGRVGGIVGPGAMGFVLSAGFAVSQVLIYFSIPLLLSTLLIIFFLRIDTRKKALEQVQAAVVGEQPVMKPA